MQCREENSCNSSWIPLGRWAFFLLALLLIVFLGSQTERVFGLSNGQNASLVIGQLTFATNKSSTTQNGLAFPEQATFDSKGNLWVSDSYYNRVLEFRPPFSNGEDASVVIGQKIFTAGEPATTRDGLRGPVGIEFDPKGNLWVADITNSRILEYAGDTPLLLPLPEFPLAPLVLASGLLFLAIFLSETARPLLILYQEHSC
jgi:hypothetical protein